MDQKVDGWFGCIAEWLRERKCDRKQTSATENRQRETENRDREKRKSDRKQVSWCFTPSQPVRLYQGERQKTNIGRK